MPQSRSQAFFLFNGKIQKIQKAALNSRRRSIVGSVNHRFNLSFVNVIMMLHLYRPHPSLVCVVRRYFCRHSRYGRLYFLQLACYIDIGFLFVRFLFLCGNQLVKSQVHKLLYAWLDSHKVETAPRTAVKNDLDLAEAIGL